MSIAQTFHPEKRVWTQTKPKTNIIKRIKFFFDTQKCLGLKISDFFENFFENFSINFLIFFSHFLRPKNLCVLRILKVWIDFGFGFGFGSTPGPNIHIFFLGWNVCLTVNVRFRFKSIVFFPIYFIFFI